MIEYQGASRPLTFFNLPPATDVYTKDYIHLSPCFCCCCCLFFLFFIINLLLLPLE